MFYFGSQNFQLYSTLKYLCLISVPRIEQKESLMVELWRLIIVATPYISL